MISINQVLSEVQRNLNAPKNQRNHFGNYNYRSCEDILEAVKAVMPEGFGVGMSDEIILVGERIYVKATATFFGPDAEYASASAFARESESQKGMSESQLTGSASSYARKYALNGLFAIDDAKDDDTRDNRPEAGKQVKAQVIGKAVQSDKKETVQALKKDIAKIEGKNLSEVDQLRAHLRELFKHPAITEEVKAGIVGDYSLSKSSSDRSFHEAIARTQQIIDNHK